ncbi:uncharacterized protein B0H18DRAFT_972204 [Fomitopsis serialis]|uniref:uncharacterized protein n=1 Tax=Fomitopsis serialis TaxID=139415 RepID=UPI0020081839|nr:uncharacterized protein B0H18DRAFT_972204 [Neoantrodia serialis]KAH9936106.1 hypothetical protein B0H18DRAFT_972204 [Neoantrodia serialis]
MRPSADSVAPLPSDESQLLEPPTSNSWTSESVASTVVVPTTLRFNNSPEPGPSSLSASESQQTRETRMHTAPPPRSPTPLSPTIAQREQQTNAKVAPLLVKAYDKRLSQERRFKALEAVVGILSEENSGLYSELGETRTHCDMARMESDDLQKKLNAKTARASQGKKRNLVTDSRTFTSGEGLAAWREQEEQRKAKEQEKTAAKARQAQKLADREVQRQQREQSGVFSGSLSSKLRDELLDIATALDIPVEGKKKPELLESIRNHFTANPELKEQPRFCGIFRGRKRTAAAAELDEPVDQPAATRRQVDTSASMSSSSTLSPRAITPTSISPTLPNIPPPGIVFPPHAMSMPSIAQPSAPFSENGPWQPAAGPSTLNFAQMRPDSEHLVASPTGTISGHYHYIPLSYNMSDVFMPRE